MQGPAQANAGPPLRMRTGSMRGAELDSIVGLIRHSAKNPTHPSLWGLHTFNGRDSRLARSPVHPGQQRVGLWLYILLVPCNPEFATCCVISGRSAFLVSVLLPIKQDESF